MSTTARPGYCEAAQRVRPGSSLRGSRGERGFISLTVVKRPLYEGQGIDFFSYNVELRPNGVAKIHFPREHSVKEKTQVLAACSPELQKILAEGTLPVQARHQDVPFGLLSDTWSQSVPTMHTLVADLLHSFPFLGTSTAKFKRSSHHGSTKYRALRVHTCRCNRSSISELYHQHPPSASSALRRSCLPLSMENSRLPLQVIADGLLAGPSTSLSVSALPHAQGITTNRGDFNQAGRDVTIHKHYYSYPDRVDISAVLGAVRNLRIIHLDILSKATPGTGIWLLKTDKFIIWLDPNGDLKILWGTGIPGAGKTVLVAIIIREFEALAAVEGSRICVCYVYIRYSDRADLSVRNILEIIVKQTVERHPDCEWIAEKAYARHIREKTQPTESELLELLRQFTEVNAATFYFLDALDEAPDWIQVDLVLKLASLNVRLFITSRPLESVQARVPAAHRFPIVAQEGDLDLHINQEISRSRDLANFLENADPSLRDEIVSLVKSKCGGMFLHASLQLDALCECATAHEVRQTLEEFPSNIVDVYLQTWNRILGQRSSHVLLAKAVLVWVLNSSRPMRIEELQQAVATSPETYKFEPNRLAPVTTLMALCQGLVTLEEESRLVRLVHYTAKDTLEGLLHGSFPRPHSYLATICMAHLTHCGFQNTTISSEEDFVAARQADPLLTYASDAWAVHARASLDVEDVRGRIASFVRESGAFPAFTRPGLLHIFDILSPLHILAMYHLPTSLITRCDIGDLNVATQIDRESPLTLASLHGHAGAVTFLLAHSEVLVNFVNKIRTSALVLAAENGHEGIVKILLAHHEIQINLASNPLRLSALMLAAKNGHESVVELLLTHPEIQVNLVDFLGRSALMLAAEIGHESIVKLLLQCTDIQVNVVDHTRYSALMFAAERGRESIVKLLLAHPEIQINLLSLFRQSALMLAARNGHESIVKLLLRRTDIQVNLVAYRRYSALTFAAEGGHQSIVHLLLNTPHINTTTKDQDGETAMWIALDNGHLGVARLLKEFHCRSNVKPEHRSVNHATVVELDTSATEQEEQGEQGDDEQEEEQEGDRDPVGGEMEEQPESEDSDCYEDAEEWLEGVDGQSV